MINMTNNITVVGKVTNGKVITMVATEDRMVGHIRPLVRTEKAAPNEVLTIQRTPVSAPKHEEIDSPFIKIANEGHKRHMAEKQARIQALHKPKKRSWFDRLHAIR
jgi:hypothetical protein